MKKIIPIFLFIIICINHLRIIDTVMEMNARYKKDVSTHTKALPADEQSENEKESKSKEKVGEQEKFYSRNSHLITRQFQLSDKDKFACYSTRLNIHPYQDDDIQPPKTV